MLGIQGLAMIGFLTCFQAHAAAPSALPSSVPSPAPHAALGMAPSAVIEQGPALEGLQPREVAFFHLHQSLGYFERARKGKCPVGLSKVSGHLEKARAILAALPQANKQKPLEAIASKIHVLQKRPESAPLAELEKIRMELYSLTLGQRYPHPDSWHAELDAACKPSP